MHCCLWFRSVFRVRGPWPKRYGYHLSIIIIIIIITPFSVFIWGEEWKEGPNDSRARDHVIVIQVYKHCTPPILVGASRWR